MTTRGRLAIALCVAFVVAAAALFVAQRWIETREAERRAEERDHLAQDFSEVGQCVFGGQPKAEEITYGKLTDISSLLDGTPGNWPFDCHDRIDRFRTRVETARYLDKTAAARISTLLYKMDEDLKERSVDLKKLADHLNKIWTEAAACGITAGTPESEAPPIPPPLEKGAAKLSIEGLTALGGGPSWQFLALDAKGFAQCELGEAKLACKRIDIGAADPAELRRADTVGSWSSPRFILLRSDKSSWLLADGKLEALPIKRRVRDAHVSATGDVIALTEAQELSRWSREGGKPSKPVKLSDALSKVGRDASRHLGDVRLLGPRLLQNPGSADLVRYDLDENGMPSNPTKLGLRFESLWDQEAFVCRAGAHDAILVASFVAFDTPQGLIKHPAQGYRCSASGVVWTDKGGCTPEGCTAYPEAIFNSQSGRYDLRSRDLLARDYAGRGQAVAWVARMGGGLLVRGNAADLATTVVVASGAELAERGEPSPGELLNGGGPGTVLGVYGGPSGAVVLYRNGRGPQLGVGVSAAGAVSPLTIEGL